MNDTGADGERPSEPTSAAKSTGPWSLLEPFEGSNTIGNSSTFWTGFGVVLLAILVYPFLTNRYRIIVTATFFIWVFLALSLSLIWGYSGIFSFGQTAFFGAGGYIFGIVGINLIDVTGATNIAVLAGILIPAVFAALVGYFMFYGRVSGVYVAIITLAITLLLELLLSRTAGQQYRVGKALLGGYNGMTGIPSLTFGYGNLTLELGDLSMYYLVVVLLLVVYLGLRYFVNSNYGYALIATREDEERTEMFGYDIRYVKLQIFTLSGGLAGLGGVLHAAHGNFISPPIMGLTVAALPVIWVTVGGRKTLLGAIIATVMLRYLDDYFAVIGSEYSLIIMGLILLGVILFFPDGVIPTVHQRLQGGNLSLLQRLDRSDG